MIRQAQPDDEPHIKHCAEQAYARYVPLMGRKPAPMVADFAAQIRAGHVFVAVDEAHHLQGFIVFYAEDDHVLLENVAVLPQCAGRGIGRSLIGFCETQAMQSGKSAVHLYTNEKMVDNLALYPRLGYSEVARRTENGFHRVYFAKQLAEKGR